MAQQREKGGRVVFIGNIPYGVSEEQICEIFGRVGQVVNFRLVYDKETGRPKGFGFLEYTDTDAAASAVRNLNEHDIMGRTLRVDYSNDNGGGKGNQQQNQDAVRAPPPAHFDQMNGAPTSNELPPLPQGAELPPGLTAPDAISKTLSSIPAPQLLDILSQMKNLVATEPQKATVLLQQAPQLSYAIFQALLLLGLVNTEVLSSLISTTAQAPQPPPQQQAPPPMSYQQPPPGYPPQQQYPPPQGYPPQPYSQPPYQQPPQHYPPPGYAPTPPVQQQYQPPPPQPQPPPMNAQDPQQAQLMQTVMALTREQIYALEEGPRNQILALRQQFGAPVM